MRCCIPRHDTDALTRARHRAFMAPRLLGSLVALRRVSGLSGDARRTDRARGRARFAWLIAPILLSWYPVAHRPLRERHARCRRWRWRRSIMMVADRDRRHRILCRGLAHRRSPGGRVVGLAPRRRVRFRSPRAVLRNACSFALGHFDLAAEAGAERRRCTDRADRASAWLPPRSMPAGWPSAAEYAGAHQRDAALSIEEDRYRLLARNMSDVISRHRRNGAVMFISPAAEDACSARTVARLHRPWPVRSRPRRGSAGLSHGAVGCRAAAAKQRASNSACAAMRPAMAAVCCIRPISSGSRCAAARSTAQA